MEIALDEQPEPIKIIPRNGFIAFLLSLLTPGLGQIYNGQPNKAAWFLFFLLSIPMIFNFAKGTTTFYGLVVFIVYVVSWKIFIIIDAIRNANRQKNFIPKSYNTWYYHLLIAIGILAIIAISNIPNRTKPFRIPTTTNHPTIIEGDKVIADLKAYKNSQPNYGDVIVYTKPDGFLYISRVVGLPKDSISVVDNIVNINGVPCHSTFIKKTFSDNMPMKIYEEELPNGHKHLLLKINQPFESDKANAAMVVVPKDAYYILGDNRDNSLDSRYIGFITKDKIKGRVLYSFWGRTGKKRMNIDFTQQ
ncbi:MAG: signal peptidase I [Chitinophagales bacterium]|nr:signal peptidase I [Chitinophagales bacterium]